MPDLLSLLLLVVLKIEVTVAVGVLVYTVTEDIVSWFADRRIVAGRGARAGGADQEPADHF